MVPIVARALMLLAVCVVLITVALLLPPGRQASAGERPVLSFLVIVAALILGIFVLLMVLFAGP
jgi:hypothetical protein